MDLTPEEADFLIQGGTRLEEVVKPRERRLFYRPQPGVSAHGEQLDPDTDRVARSLKVGHGLQQLVTDCGYLAMSTQGSFCLVYEDPRRPAVCRDFSEGSFGCRSLSQRYLQNCDQAVPVTLTRNPNLPTPA